MPSIFRFAAAALFAASMCASAAAADFAQTARAGIAAAKIPSNHLAIFIAPADLQATLFAHNSERALAPASAIKIATGFAALALLGPDFKWRTQWLADGALEGSTLRGDLIFRGGGDPLVTVDRFLKMILDLRATGIETIDGDFVVDDSFFALSPHDPAAFDGAGLRSYNVGGGAAAVNFKTHRVVIFPRGGKIAARLDPPSDKVKLVNRLRPRKRRCRSWRSGFREIVKTRADGSVELSLVGGYPPRCGENGFYFAPPLSHADYVGGVFTALWRQLGGAFAPGGGAVKIGARAGARVVAEYESPPLSDAVKQMNKFSNNFIARNIFLSLPIGAGAPPPYTLTAARRTAADFIAARAGEDVFIDNGSGLSRKTKISAGALARLLRGGGGASVARRDSIVAAHRRHRWHNEKTAAARRGGGGALKRRDFERRFGVGGICRRRKRRRVDFRRDGERSAGAAGARVARQSVARVVSRRRQRSGGAVGAAARITATTPTKKEKEKWRHRQSKAKSQA